MPVPPPSPPDVPAFEAEGLGVSLGGRPILRDLSFAIPRGAWVGLLGPNGAGKTTLVHALAGLLPHTGRLALFGRPLGAWRDRERARAVAVVRQQPSLDFDFTVEEVVALGRAPHRSWLAGLTDADRAALASALAQTDLGRLAHRSVVTLSGGEGQRVLLAQALAQDAPVLLLDEPTAHLDVHHQYDLMDRVAALDGRTVVAAFHDLAFAARYADRLLVLHDGRLAADGPPADVLTPALLRRVFRMDAEVEATPGGLAIRYLGPVVRGSSSVEGDPLP
ncbi:MAG: ABC transporter ATP-binding protein [Rubricoccaceae bacterium]|nr:ABC transporter ATP-binding protein [Rubricoccaceae bacterium]